MTVAWTTRSMTTTRRRFDQDTVDRTTTAGLTGDPLYETGSLEMIELHTWGTTNGPQRFPLSC